MGGGRGGGRGRISAAGTQLGRAGPHTHTHTHTPWRARVPGVGCVGTIGGQGGGVTALLSQRRWGRQGGVGARPGPFGSPFPSRCVRVVMRPSRRVSESPCVRVAASRPPCPSRLFRIAVCPYRRVRVGVSELRWVRVAVSAVLCPSPRIRVAVSESPYPSRRASGPFELLCPSWHGRVTMRPSCRIRVLVSESPCLYRLFRVNVSESPYPSESTYLGRRIRESTCPSHRVVQRVLVVGDVIVSASDDYDLRLWDFAAPGRPGPAPPE